MARKKTRYAFGFDPSINDAAWAVVDTNGNVRCGLIRNSHVNKKHKLDPWEKLEHLLEDLQPAISNLVPSIPDIDVWVCEGQYAPRRGNQESNIRLGWISALVYSYGKTAKKRKIAIPSQWTRNVPKEIRHDELLKRVSDEEEWKWLGKPAPKSLMHNIYDAVGLAVWGLEQEGLL